MNSKMSSAEKHDRPKNKVEQSPKPKGVSEFVKNFNIPMLKYDNNAPSNWSAFLKALSTVAGIQFGSLFQYVQDGAYPAFDMPVLKSCAMNKQLDLERINALYPDQTSPEYLEALAIHTAQFNISEAERDVLDTMYLEDYRAARKQVEELRSKLNDNKPKLYWLIKANLSPESLQCVSAKLLDRFEIMDREADPLLLFKTLKETHTAFGTGARPSDAARARSKYHLLKQGDKESLSSFKERLDTHIKAMEALGLDIPSPEEQAADLITKVNAHFAPAATKNDDAFRMTSKYCEQSSRQRKRFKIPQAQRSPRPLVRSPPVVTRSRRLENLTARTIRKSRRMKQIQTQNLIRHHQQPLIQIPQVGEAVEGRRRSLMLRLDRVLRPQESQ